MYKTYKRRYKDLLKEIENAAKMHNEIEEKIKDAKNEYDRCQYYHWSHLFTRDVFGHLLIINDKEGYKKVYGKGV